MHTLADSNVLLRSVDFPHPQRPAVVRAVKALDAGGTLVVIVPQIVYEFWVVATRPQAQNGLGMTVSAASAELRRLRNVFVLLADPTDLFPEWQRTVVEHAVTGKQAHDARIAAAMRLLGIRRILTFNTADFARYDFIQAISPANV